MLLVAAAAIAWIRILPLSLGELDDRAATRLRAQIAAQVEAQLPESIPPTQRRAEIDRVTAVWIKDHGEKFETWRREQADLIKSDLTYKGDDGRDHVFLGDFDSYHWLRMARNYLRTGTTCDQTVGGVCRDTMTNAPVGRLNIYNRSLHIAAIVAVARLMALIRPGFPLPASAFLVPVLVAILGVFPAFAIGRRLAGNLGGLAAAVIIGLNPMFLKRSIGVDNDVWNVVLPLFIAWAAIEALAAPSSRRQIAHAAIAAGFVGLHAATWSGWTFAYGAILIALLANLLYEAAKIALRNARSQAANNRALKTAALVAGVFYFSAWITTALAGAPSYLAATKSFVPPLAGLSSAGPTRSSLLARNMDASPEAESLWPDNFSIVAEIEPRGLPQIADSLGGRWALFAAALGLLILVLPRARWRRWDFALLAAGAFCCSFLLAGWQIDRRQLIALLAAPIGAAMLVDLFVDGGPSGRDRGAALIVIVWFCAAAFLAFGGDRFVMLLAPPFGIAFAALLGRSYRWIDRALRARQFPYAAWASAAAFGLLAGVPIVYARAGYATARTYVPHMNQAWWSTLGDLREQSPPNAIVNAWWDYGYWIKYAAERRVSADGGSLSTHIPYWLGRALLAPDDNQAAGLLRMLDCGSEASPAPEGKQGAYGKLVAAKVDSFAARSLLPELADLDFADARARLARSGLGESAQDSVLASTHCSPPSAYLVLSTGMVDSGWQRIGNWDFRRAYAWEHDRAKPVAAAVDDLTRRLGMSPSDARALYHQLADLHSEDDVEYFISPSDPFVGNGWIPCGNPGDAELECHPNLPIGGGALLTGIQYGPQDTQHTTKLKIAFVSPTDNKVHQLQGPPALVELATEKELVRQTVASPAFRQIAVLVDPSQARILVGPSFLIDSTFTRLLFLGGAYSKLFTKAYQATGFGGEIVTAWKINWPDLTKAPVITAPK